MERRLAAILAADVVGYSRLIRADEEGTLDRLKALRNDLIDPKIAEHKGRIVKLMGDGMLAEFASVVDAVRAAVETQQALAARNGGLPEEQRMVFRMGINLGDIVIDGDDIQGDGVNVAARLEGLAEPGGISVSGAVYEQIRDRSDLAFEDLGEQQVKNIDRPVRVWRWTGDPSLSARMPEAKSAPLPLPDKPSIAVLPFDNMSDDAEQAFFADGITEDIITELSRFPELFVIARNSAFTYKGRAVKVQEVGRELGVQYVVEGSVRKAGQRVRVTVQLIDAASGNHIWAERYDRELVDIFDLQDELTQAIVAVLPGRLEGVEAERLKRKPTEDMAAYDYLLAGKIHHHRYTEEDNAEALRLLDRAIELDPDFAAAYAWKACTLGQALGRGFGGKREGLLEGAVEAVEKAFSLDENEVECHRILCEVNMVRRQWDQARRHSDRALALNANDPRLLAQKGELLTWMGDAEEGARWVERSMRLDPYGAHVRAHLLGRAFYVCRQYGEAVEAYKRIPSPRLGHHADLAACYAQMGMAAEAKEEADEVLRLKPDFTVEGYAEGLHYKDQALREHHQEGLQKAGLPA